MCNVNADPGKILIFLAKFQLLDSNFSLLSYLFGMCHI